MTQKWFTCEKKILRSNSGPQENILYTELFNMNYKAELSYLLHSIENVAFRVRQTKKKKRAAIANSKRWRVNEKWTERKCNVKKNQRTWYNAKVNANGASWCAIAFIFAMTIYNNVHKSLRGDRWKRSKLKMSTIYLHLSNIMWQIDGGNRTNEYINECTQIETNIQHRVLQGGCFRRSLWLFLSPSSPSSLFCGGFCCCSRFFVFIWRNGDLFETDMGTMAITGSWQRTNEWPRMSMCLLYAFVFILKCCWFVHSSY